MQVVYVYQGGRDRALEQQILDRFPDSRCVTALSGMQGLTEVTLDLPPSLTESAVDQLRALPWVVDAARGSLGEGV